MLLASLSHEAHARRRCRPSPSPTIQKEQNQRHPRRGRARLGRARTASPAVGQDVGVIMQRHRLPGRPAARDASIASARVPHHARTRSSSATFRRRAARHWASATPRRLTWDEFAALASCPRPTGTAHRRPCLAGPRSSAIDGSPARPSRSTSGISSDDPAGRRAPAHRRPGPAGRRPSSANVPGRVLAAWSRSWPARSCCSVCVQPLESASWPAADRVLDEISRRCPSTMQVAHLPTRLVDPSFAEEPGARQWRSSASTCAGNCATRLPSRRRTTSWPRIDRIAMRRLGVEEPRSVPLERLYREDGG